jgi:hypothetical protein
METLVLGKHEEIATQHLDYWCMKREVMYYQRVQMGGIESKVWQRWR